jgi:hypothetical protein
MHRDRHIRARGTPKAAPDVRKLARALLALAMAQARVEKEAQEHAEQEASKPNKDRPRRPA